MSLSAREMKSGILSIAIVPQPNGHYLCELTPRLEGHPAGTKQFQGQTPKHAVAIALENMAHALRVEAEAEQNLDWDAEHKLPLGKVNKKRFHVILHYERVGDEASKFEAMVNTQMGNTVVENAEISIIQIDPDLLVVPVESRRGSL
jgi:hypothetical protein